MTKAYIIMFWEKSTVYTQSRCNAVEVSCNHLDYYTVEI